VIEPENSPPGCAVFGLLFEELKWRVVRREKDRVIIERVSTGEQGEIKDDG
jgi:hypothetical protein